MYADIDSAPENTPGGVQKLADIVIEILSSRTAKEDKNRKKNVYERCGVKEYWIVDPVTKKTIGFSLETKRLLLLLLKQVLSVLFY